MNAYYNDIEPFCCDVLEARIADGRIPAGKVDRRSITEVTPDDVAGFKQCHFFAGIGGFAYACRLAGWPDDRAIWTAGFPCQDISTAGRGAGIKKGTRSGLWREIFRLIRNVRPPLVVFENVPAIRTRGYDRIADAMARIDYSVRSVVVGAWAVGATIIGDRAWILSEAEGDRRESWSMPIRTDAKVSNAAGVFGHRWPERPIEINRVPIATDGIPKRLAWAGQARATDNAIVPQVAAAILRAWMKTERAA